MITKIEWTCDKCGFEMNDADVKDEYTTDVCMNCGKVYEFWTVQQNYVPRRVVAP